MNGRVATHRLVVDLSSKALRQGIDLVETGSYASIDDLIEALLLSPEAPEASAPTTASATTRMRMPPAEPGPTLAPAPGATRGVLQFLTNRLSPLKLSVRVLAALSEDGEWPDLRTFQLAAARTARETGLRIRTEDKEAGRRGAARRFVGYPVGDDQDAAFNRFIFSFTIDEVGGQPAGPLAVLGLAALDEGRVVLTPAGRELAWLTGPLLDGGEGTLAAEEAQVLKAQLRLAEDERDAVAEFLALVHRATGTQSRVDELLATRHPEWSSDRAAAHRAAMLGRLGELRVVRVTGRGSRARIELLDTEGLEGEKGSSV